MAKERERMEQEQADKEARMAALNAKRAEQKKLAAEKARREAIEKAREEMERRVAFLNKHGV